MGSVFGGAPKTPNYAKQEARRQAKAEAEERAEKLAQARKSRQEAQAAEESEAARLDKLNDRRATIATSGAGLLTDADVRRTELKTKLGE